MWLRSRTTGATCTCTATRRTLGAPTAFGSVDTLPTRPTAASAPLTGRYLVTTGGGDQCVFVWRHLEPGEELEEDEEDEDTVVYDGGKGNQTVLMVQAGMEKGNGVYEPVNAIDGVPNPYKNHSLAELGCVRGYKSPMVGKACLGQTHPPTSWKLDRTTAYKEPDETLELSWVWGFRGHDTRNAVFFDWSCKVVYPAAAWGIVYDPATGAQQHITDDPDTDTSRKAIATISCALLVTRTRRLSRQGRSAESRV